MVTNNYFLNDTIRLQMSTSANVILLIFDFAKVIFTRTKVTNTARKTATQKLTSRSYRRTFADLSGNDIDGFAWAGHVSAEKMIKSVWEMRRLYMISSYDYKLCVIQPWSKY